MRKVVTEYHDSSCATIYGGKHFILEIYMFLTKAEKEKMKAERTHLNDKLPRDVNDLKEKFHLYDCCNYPIVFPSKKVNEMCSEKPELCSEFSCFDEQMKFFVNGKLNKAEIFKAFGNEVTLTGWSLDIWKPVLEESIKICSSFGEDV
jgi:hypothetical protein